MRVTIVQHLTHYRHLRHNDHLVEPALVRGLRRIKVDSKLAD